MYKCPFIKTRWPSITNALLWMVSFLTCFTREVHVGGKPAVAHPIAHRRNAVRPLGFKWRTLYNRADFVIWNVCRPQGYMKDVNWPSTWKGSRAGVFNPRPAGHLRPSGEFCATREGYFTKYNALWILKLESLDTKWLKENKFTARSKILNNYPKL